MLVLLGSSAACAPIPPIPTAPRATPTSRPAPRTSEAWTKDKILQVAQSMQAETDYPNIMTAGRLLERNQQGLPSFSEVTPLLTDDPLTIVGHNFPPTRRAPIQSVISSTVRIAGPVEQFVIPSIQGEGSMFSFMGPTSYRLEQLDIDEGVLQGRSPFFLRFLMASQLFIGKAIDGLALDAVIQAGLMRELKRNDKREKNAILLNQMNGVGIGELRGAAVAQIWSSFYLIPDYQMAVDGGRFTPEDLALLPRFRSLSQFFQKEGILSRQSDGGYIWKSNAQKLYDVWFDAAYQESKIVSSAPIAPSRGR